MVYTVMSVCINPGRSWEGIEQLRVLARWLTDKYGAETTLLGSSSGADDRKQLVTRFQSPAQMREIDRRLIQDSEFAPGCVDQRHWYAGTAPPAQFTR